MFPLDLNKAPRELLLRIAGLGTKSVERILQVRSWHKLRLNDLPRLHLSVNKVLPFVITADYNSATLAIDRDDLSRRFVRPEKQLDLFAPDSSVLSGQL